MQVRNLGNSNLKTSFIGLGTMNFGASNDEKECHEILDYYTSNGGNFIDTANIYSLGNAAGSFHERGHSEQIIGSWLKKKRRESVILATKVKADMGDGHSGLSRRSIFFQIDQSLKRLGTDYIDLYQTHGFDPNVPLGETLEAMDELQKSGKIRYYGCCNFDSSQIADSCLASKKSGISGFVSYQNAYNLIVKERLKNFKGRKYILSAAECQKYGIGLITYNALANGFLAGRFRKDVNGEPSSRGGDEVIRKNCYNNEGWKLLGILDELAGKYNTSVGAIVLSWYRNCDFISTVLVGPRTSSQIRDLLQSPDIALSREEFSQIDVNCNF